MAPCRITIAPVEASLTSARVMIPSPSVSMWVSMDTSTAHMAAHGTGVRRQPCSAQGGVGVRAGATSRLGADAHCQCPGGQSPGAGPSPPRAVVAAPQR
eukprot:3051338-Prymnesium_polylepis.1